ncbi:MAG: hypothetical protein JSU70_16425, partial [Phycisphaerales bacterium]
IMQNKANFPGVEINATSFGEKYYDDFATLSLRENKANRQPLAERRSTEPDNSGVLPDDYCPVLSRKS